MRSVKNALFCIKVSVSIRSHPEVRPHLNRTHRLFKGNLKNRTVFSLTPLSCPTMGGGLNIHKMPQWLTERDPEVTSVWNVTQVLDTVGARETTRRRQASLHRPQGPLPASVCPNTHATQHGVSVHQDALKAIPVLFFLYYSAVRCRIGFQFHRFACWPYHQLSWWPSNKK